VEKYRRTTQAKNDDIIGSEKIGFLYWLTKAKIRTHTTFNTYCFSTKTMVTRTRLSFTFTCFSCLFRFSTASRPVLSLSSLLYNKKRQLF